MNSSNITSEDSVDLETNAKKLLVKTFSISHPGYKRHVNEDAYLNRDSDSMWLVADGMGGHTKGDVASKLIVSRIESLELPTRLPDRIETIEDALIEVNNHLCQETEMCGSTVVLLTFVDNLACILWAGDSRLYLYRDELRQLSVDHSHVQQLIHRGELTIEESEQHPLANVITRAVGADEKLMLELKCHDYKFGDRFILCSDGLSKELSHKQIEELASTGDVKKCCEGLLASVLSNGASDNVTITVVDVLEVDEKSMHDHEQVEALSNELAKYYSQFVSGRFDKCQYMHYRSDLFIRFKNNLNIINNMTIPISDLYQTIPSESRKSGKWLWLVFVIIAAVFGVYYAFR
ncbi:serine/threonine-protein phosphatase [Photobacterium sanctipauli]|uniref:Serine/threonine-protein phosphatase n=1 Tax=Photobacterium sanctipauli TaxID=1342794 RepID=A0A2T3NU40_9GAMM|nr:protein phosphatase 2C domain-containing protein [Photobacterium sanctipauli]PSW19784.1 serine/threonine-protein phosphatase [Photobacterium sanctipauli]